MYECDKCGQISKFKSVLKTHMNVHKKTRCKICHENLINRSTLKMHMRIHTLNSRSDPNLYLDKYECIDCAISFSSDFLARSHRRLKHKLKTICRKCNKYFIQIYIHLRTHEAPAVKCLVEGCTRVFRSKQNMKDHLGNFHKLNFKVKCPKCEKVFARKYLINFHLLHIHKDMNLSNSKLERSNIQAANEERLFHEDLSASTCY